MLGSSQPARPGPGHPLFDLILHHRLFKSLDQLWACLAARRELEEAGRTVDEVEMLAAEQEVFRVLLEAGFSSDYLFQPSGNGHLSEEQRRALAVAREDSSLFEVHYLNPASPVAAPAPALIQGLLHPGYVLMAGPSKLAMKTWFSLGMALHLHTGIPFLGRPVIKSEVCFIQVDMPEFPFQEYSAKLVKGMGIPEKQLPYFFSSATDLANPKQWPQLCRKLEELGTQVLIIDSSRAATSVKEEDSTEVRVITRNLICQQLRNHLGLTVILICHTPHGQFRPRGSGEWTASADSIIEFHPPEGGKGAVELHILGRHPTVDPFSFELRDVPEGTCLFEVSKEEAAARRVFITPDQVGAAYRCVLANPDGVSQAMLKTELSASGCGLRNIPGQGNRLLDTVLEHHPDVAYKIVRNGRYPARILFIQGK